MILADSSTRLNKWNDSLFLFCVFSLNFCTIFLANVNKSVFVVAKIGVLILLCIVLISQELLYKKWWYYCAVLAFCGLSYWVTKNTILPYYAIALLISRHRNLDKVAKVDCISKLVLIPIVAILSSVGVTLNPFFAYTNRIVYYFGFSNPNNFFFSFFILCFDILFISRHFKKSHRISILFLLLIFGFVFYEQTNCRTGFLVQCLLEILLFAYWFCSIGKNKHFLSFLSFGFIFCAIFSISFIFYPTNDPLNSISNSSLYNSLDGLFSQRIRFSTYFYQEYGFSIFGQYVHTVTQLEAIETGQKALNIDNLYVYFSLSYGILLLCFTAFLSFSSGRFFAKQKLGEATIFLFCLAVYSLMEKVYINFEYNVWVILLGYSLLNGRVLNNQTRNGLLPIRA